MSLSETKQALRDAARARRRAAHAADGASAALALADGFERLVTVSPGAVIAGYWPAGSEIDVRPLLARLHARGHALALPVVVAPDAALAFRAWRPGATLVPAEGGGLAPEAAVGTRVPDLLLVPLLAFDPHGARLGQGGGYYDRTLAALRAERTLTALGVAFAVQALPEIPTDAYDQALDAILTEAGLIEAR